MELLNKFTENFTHLFEETGLSKVKFAQRIGINHSQVTNFLNGSIPYTDTANKLCNYFNCSLDYLVGLTYQFNYKNSKAQINPKNFYSEYTHLLQQNKTNHFQLSKRGVVCETSLRLWKSGKLPKFEVLILIANELGGSIDKMLGKI